MTEPHATLNLQRLSKSRRWIAGGVGIVAAVLTGIWLAWQVGAPGSPSGAGKNTDRAPLIDTAVVIGSAREPT